MFPDEGFPCIIGRIHRQGCGGTVRARRAAETLVPAHGSGSGRTGLAVDRQGRGTESNGDGQQALCVSARLRVSAEGIWRASERAGHRASVRWAESEAADVLLPEAALPRCAHQLFRSRGKGTLVSSFARILPFVKPIEHLLVDPTVTEVMVNAGGRRVFVERGGALEEVEGLVLDERNLKVAIKNIARTCGDEVSEAQPILDARLEDGSRVAAMFPPCSVNGPTLTIRKFTHRYTLEELVSIGTLPAHVGSLLERAVRSQQNVLISGGTGTGKTTLLNALAATIPDRDRIVLIEETSEVVINKRNLVRFEARRAQMPLGHEVPLPAVTIAELLRATLRHRPDRILVGEVRGPEAFDLLQALNTGHLGSIS